MKKLFLSSLAVFIVFLSQAQIKKGTVFIGGNIGFSNQTAKTTDSVNLPVSPGTSFNFNPSVGWAIKDNLVFGIDLVYGYQKINYPPSYFDYYYKQESYSAGVFLRRYKVLGSGFSIFGQASLHYSYSKNTYYTNTWAAQSNILGVQSAKNYGGTLGFYPGIAYTVSRHWQMETGLPNLVHINYTHSKQTYRNQVPNSPESQATSDTFNAGTSLGNYFQFSVGVLYVI
jgi:hypothetical protein